MSDEITAVILAGGEGTRLRPLTNTRPKPLLPVLGRPCVEYVIRSLADAGVGTAYLTCGYRSQDMVDALGDGRAVRPGPEVRLRGQARRHRRGGQAAPERSSLVPSWW